MLLIHQLYNNILESHKYINKININKKNAIEFKKDLEYNDDLFPREIKNYIKSKIKHMTRYKTQINSRDVVINIYSRDFSYNDSEMIYKILLIINVLSLYTSKECSKNLHINIFLTPFKKMLPKKSSDILGPINVNSGFSTSGCINSGKITIYREEEWFKVLIHELFHNFNLDFATMNINKWKDKMLDIFDIQSEYNIYETPVFVKSNGSELPWGMGVTHFVSRVSGSSTFVSGHNHAFYESLGEGVHVGTFMYGDKVLVEDYQMESLEEFFGTLL